MTNNTSKLFKARTSQSGDTLIEVLMAIVILSVVIVGAIGLMNSGVSSNLTATEHTKVQLLISGQANQLSYIRDDYVNKIAIGQSIAAGTPAATWRTLIRTSNNYISGTTPGDKNSSACTPQTARPFYLKNNPLTPMIPTIEDFSAGNKPQTYATPGEGLWIEGYRSASSVNPGYIDFIIRACWEPASNSVTQREAMVTRLYDAT